MIAWPAELVEDIARRRCVMFLGAGISQNSKNSTGQRPPDWEGFLRAAQHKIVNTTHAKEVSDTIDNKDLLTACELARRYLGPSAFKTLLLTEFSSKAYQSAQIHDDLTALDSRMVITTNFDKIYETRANTLLHNSVIVKTYDDDDAADFLRRSDRCVIKMHGTIDAPDRAVFTRSSYAIARNKYASFFKMIDALFLTNTFVFMGASMRDPDLQLILEDQAYRFPGSRPHYLVTPLGETPESVLRIMQESMNLVPLPYDKANSHAELAHSIADLRPQVEAARLTLAQTQNW